MDYGRESSRSRLANLSFSLSLSLTIASRQLESTNGRKKIGEKLFALLRRRFHRTKKIPAAISEHLVCIAEFCFGPRVESSRMCFIKRGRKTGRRGRKKVNWIFCKKKEPVRRSQLFSVRIFIDCSRVCNCEFTFNNNVGTFLAISMIFHGTRAVFDARVVCFRMRFVNLKESLLFQVERGRF